MSLRGSFMPKKAAVGAAAPNATPPAAAPHRPAHTQPQAPSKPIPTKSDLTIRRATLDDTPTIHGLIEGCSLLQRENMIRSFGQQQIHTLIESCVLSLCVESSLDGSLVGFAAFGDDAPPYFMRVCNENALSENTLRKASHAPRIGGEQRCEGDWNEFIVQHFETATEALTDPTTLGGLTTFNTTWLRFMVMTENETIADMAVDRILQSLFSTLTQVDSILVSIPAAIDPFSPLSSTDKFEELHLRTEFDEFTNPASITDLRTLRLFACPRAWFLPNLVLRRARIEDNDDLVPICNAQSEILTEIYGEFFLATLIQNQNAHQHALVAEVNGRAVGLTGVTDQVDVQLLQQCFDLEEYEQLRKQKTPEQEAEENSGPTPITRMNNIFLTIVSNTAPLSAAEKAAHAQAMAANSKRSSLAASKRASTNALAGIAGLLNKDAAAAAGGIMSPPQPSSNLLSPVSAIGTLNPSTPTVAGSGKFDYPDLIGGGGGSLIHIAPSTTFPTQWLLNYLETFRPDPTLVEKAQELHAARQQESYEEDMAGIDHERSEEEEETDEAILLNSTTIFAKIQAYNNDISGTMDNQSFNDFIVSLLTDDSDDALPISMGGLIRFFELVTSVPSNMPVRPPPVILDATVDDGTAKENVFCITLFCLDEQYESRSIDVLKAAFDLYTDRNYCVLTLPHTSPPSSIHLLKYFTYIRPTSRNTFGHALYLLHRDTISTLNTLKVHAPILTLPESSKSREISPAQLTVAEESSLDRLLASVTPLIAHLPNVASITSELSASIKTSLEIIKSKVEGTEHHRLNAKSVAGLSGKELLDKRREIRLQLLESKTSPTETLLISCQGSVVGLVLFNRLSSEEVALLRSDFGLDEFISYQSHPHDPSKISMPRPDPHDPQAPLMKPLEDIRTSVHLNIMTMIINPLWNGSIDFVCKELLRIKKAQVLYYQVWSKRGVGRPPALRQLSELSGLNMSYKFATGLIVPQLIDTFVQVRPRKRPAILHEHEVEMTDKGLVQHTPLPCALHVLSRRLIAQPKTVINSRLVLVGSSTTSLAFLETLLLIPDKHYSSITLLSKSGLTTGSSGSGDSIARSKHFLPWSLAFQEAWMDRLAVGSRIRVIKGTMVDLNSQEKTLILADGSTLPYDVLVLTPGLQNSLPLRLIRSITAHALGDELRAKEASRLAREEAIRDARRKKKAQEQGLEDTSTLDAEALARLDEELEREAARAKERAEDGDSNASDDDDIESVASFDSKGKSIRRKRGRKVVSASSASQHSSWKNWVTWSSSGLENWEADFGTILAKQRALDEGTLDPTAALEANEKIRAQWRGGALTGDLTDEMQSGEVEEVPFDPSTLDLTPYGISGLYSLSSEDHVSHLLKSFHSNLDRHTSGGWLVYGTVLEGLTCLQGLMELGIHPTLLTWIQKESPRDGLLGTIGHESDQLFLEPIFKAIAILGITVHTGKVIKHVKQEEGKVYAVILEDANTSKEAGVEEKKSSLHTDSSTGAGDAGLLELAAVGVIGCGDLDVDPYIFRAVHGNSLVYDGRLVLNHSFQSSSSSIYAGGPLAKFSRTYGTRVLPLKEYNSVEVGQKLCQAVLKNSLDIAGALAAEVAAKKAEASKAASVKKGAAAKQAPPASKLPPLGVQPKVTQALLPGNLLYFHAATPTDRRIVQPKVLVTQSRHRIVRLVLNDANILHSMTILSSYSPLDTIESGETPNKEFMSQATSIHSNLVQLLGMPSSYMNRILFRYEKGQISDLVEFLSGSWSFGLYHEAFSELRAYLHYFMLENRFEIVAIIDRIIQIFTHSTRNGGGEDEDVGGGGVDGDVIARNEVDGSSRTSIDPFLVSQLTSLLPSSMKDHVQRSLLRFLKQHENHLPGYTIEKPHYNGPQARPRINLE